MSDPVTNVEIEDVLSSIRRLVSQDSDVAKPADKREPTALILTEDHRVDAANVAEQARNAAADAAAKGAALRENAATAVRSELERAIEELEAAMGIDPVADESPDTEAEITAELDELEFGGENAEADDSEEQTDQIDASHGEVSDAVGFAVEEANTAQTEENSEQEHHQRDTGTEWPSEGDDHGVEQLVAAEFEDHADQNNEEIATGDDVAFGDDIDWDAPVGRAVDGDPADAEFDVPEMENAVDVDQQNEAFEDQFREAQEDQPEAEAEPGEPEEPHAVERVAEGAAPKSAVEALQLVSDRAQTETYDEAYEAEILDGPTHDEDDVVSFTPDQAPSEEEGAFADTAEASSEAWDEPLGGAEQTLEMDEEMLRDMVAEIVRSELQGELGERITRNVRKLVRREINRALAGQDLI